MLVLSSAITLWSGLRRPLLGRRGLPALLQGPALFGRGGRGDPMAGCCIGSVSRVGLLCSNGTALSSVAALAAACRIGCKSCQAAQVMCAAMRPDNKTRGLAHRYGFSERTWRTCVILSCFASARASSIEPRCAAKASSPGVSSRCHSPASPGLRTYNAGRGQCDMLMGKGL